MPPQKAAVWEITGAEFSKSEAHTADGISIRFPRCTRIRDDKDWKSATNLPQLKVPAVCLLDPAAPACPRVPTSPLPIPPRQAGRTEGDQTAQARSSSCGLQAPQARTPGRSCSPHSLPLGLGPRPHLCHCSGKQGRSLEQRHGSQLPFLSSVPFCLQPHVPKTDGTDRH